MRELIYSKVSSAKLKLKPTAGTVSGELQSEETQGWNRERACWWTLSLRMCNFVNYCGKHLPNGQKKARDLPLNQLVASHPCQCPPDGFGSTAPILMSHHPKVVPPPALRPPGTASAGELRGRRVLRAGIARQQLDVSRVRTHSWGLHERDEDICSEAVILWSFVMSKNTLLLIWVH